MKTSISLGELSDQKMKEMGTCARCDVVRRQVKERMNAKEYLEMQDTNLQIFLEEQKAILWKCIRIWREELTICKSRQMK